MCRAPPYYEVMSIFEGWRARGRALFNDSKGPWGSSSGSGGDEPPPPPKGPWGEPPKRGGAKGPVGRSSVSSLDDFLKKNRDRFGGSNGGGPVGTADRPDPKYLYWGLGAFVILWLLFTTMHRIAPGERGVVTTFGEYSRTLDSGIGLTFPEVTLGSAAEETLMLTGDQNIIDIAYQVRWNIRDPEQYLFELASPDDTIRQVAESVMRATVAQVTLNDAIGNRRGEIEARVTEEMQRTLDSYQAGVVIQGVAIKQADPPAAVNDAFKDVTAAQQEAGSYINQANAYALQLRQKAQGEATAFDKVYDQYKLAPVVTKRRMYYETMERVLQKVDKTIIEAPGVTSYLPLNELRRAPKEPAQ